MSITLNDIARLRSLHEQATQGPWRQGSGSGPDYMGPRGIIGPPPAPDHGGWCVLLIANLNFEEAGAANIALTAAMRNALPELLDAAEAHLKAQEDAEWANKFNAAQVRRFIANMDAEEKEANHA
jgi:hypothetical protein